MVIPRSDDHFGTLPMKKLIVNLSAKVIIFVNMKNIGCYFFLTLGFYSLYEISRALEISLARLVSF